MPKADIIKKFPWINRPLILIYADKFTQAQFQDMQEAGVPAFLTSGIIDDLLSPALFDSILALTKMPEIITLMHTNQVSFKQIVITQIQQVTSAASQQQALGRPTEVIEWFGPKLASRVESEVTSYDMMDNIVQALSSSNVRAILAGDPIAIHALPFIPPALAKLKGQDARNLMMNHKMTLDELIKLATLLSNPVQRQLPDWIEDNIELRGIANQFTDMQLAELGKLLTVGIRNDRELKCSFLRAILLETCINGQQKIHECSDTNTFKQLALTLQRRFLDIAQKQASQFHSIDAFEQSDIPVLAPFNTEPTNKLLIRKYLAEYNSPHVPIPTDTVLLQQAFECALRNAANIGNFWDLLVLIHAVPNINASGPRTGKTALHFAAAHASRTGDRLCFDVLAGRPEIDFSIEDKDHKTALELWDFEKCPDDFLMEKRTLYRMSSLTI